MKILQISPRLPYPLTDGGAVGIFKATEATARAGAEITFVTYPEADREVTRKGVAALSEFAQVHLVSKPLPSRNRTLARTLFSGAYPVERRMMPEMFELLRALVQKEQFDLVHVDHAHMGKYAIWLKQEFGLPYLLREHNFEALIYERFASTQSNPIKKALAATHGKRLKIDEIRFIREADHVCPITEEDLALMKRAVPDQDFTIIPAGVDTDYFRPSSTPVDANLVLWVGGMTWDPNRDALEYFLSDVWPLIRSKRRDVLLELVGDGTQNFTGLAGVIGHGRVPDVRPYLAKAAVLVVPLRVGGGMRLKILDFLSSGKAVVTTTIGAEGNMAVDKRDLLVADDPADFAAAVDVLLRDPERRDELGKNGRTLTEEYYSWTKIGRSFVSAYEAVLARQSAPISAHQEL